MKIRRYLIMWDLRDLYWKTLLTNILNKNLIPHFIFILIFEKKWDAYGESQGAVWGVSQMQRAPLPSFLSLSLSLEKKINSHCFLSLNPFSGLLSIFMYSPFQFDSSSHGQGENFPVFFKKIWKIWSWILFFLILCFSWT